MLKSLLAIVVALGFVATSCGSGQDRVLSDRAAEIFGGSCASRSGDEVVIYSGRTENLIEPVLDAFACETGIPVAVRWGASTDLALLIDAEGERTDADVFLSRSPGPVGFLESKGFLQPVGSDVLGLVSDENRSANGTWVGFSGRKRVLVYNIDNVEVSELPSSVFELIEDPWRGRVGIPATNGSFVDWFTVFRDVHGNDVAKKWLEDMVSNQAKLYPNNRSIVEAAGRGEVDVGLVNHYYNYQEMTAGGDAHRALNHDFREDDIGSLLIITAATVIGGTDVAKEANDLLSYLLSAPVQRYFTERTFEYPLAAGVKPNEVLPNLSALEIGSVDFDGLGGGFSETNDMIEASGILSR